MIWIKQTASHLFFLRWYSQLTWEIFWLLWTSLTKQKSFLLQANFWSQRERDSLNFVVLSLEMTGEMHKIMPFMIRNIASYRERKMICCSIRSSILVRYSWFILSKHSNSFLFNSFTLINSSYNSHAYNSVCQLLYPRSSLFVCVFPVRCSHVPASDWIKQFLKPIISTRTNFCLLIMEFRWNFPCTAFVF